MSTRRRYQSPQRLTVPAELVFDYRIREVESPRELILILHGYGESGERVLEKLLPALPDDALVIAPNGPFPMPYKVEGGYKVGFAWYIYNPVTDEYFIDQKIAIRFVVEALARLKLEKLPTRIIGFSQGGYLAPFLAQTLDTVTQVIGIACDNLHEELELDRLKRVRIDAVHGELDETVRAANAKKSLTRLNAAGIVGTYVGLPGVGHRITPEVQAAVKALLCGASAALLL